MKTKHLFSVPLLLSGLMLLGLASCNSGSIVKRATGVPYEVLVVMDTNLWKGQVGEAVRDKLQESYPALPQAEPTAAVSYCEPASFNDFMRYVRNILLVDVNPSAYTKVSLVADKDVWSSGQQVMRLQSPSTSRLQLIRCYGTCKGRRMISLPISDKWNRNDMPNIYRRITTACWQRRHVQPFNSTSMHRKR